MALTVDEALRRGEDAWADGRIEEALDWARRATALAPDDEDAVELEASALLELGDAEGAVARFDALCEAAPDEPLHQVASAEARIRAADGDATWLEEALARLDRAAALARPGDDLGAELCYLRGLALGDLGDAPAAVAQLERACTLDASHQPARLELALALLEAGRFDEAHQRLEALARAQPDEPRVFHALGLLAERRGDDAEADARFARARALDPEGYPAPVHLSEAAFDDAVGEALARLPAHARPALDNVTIRAEAFPSDDDVREGISPTSLGVFQGTPLDERSPVEAAHHQTARIALFQRNLERFARSREELLEEIGVTVLHEVGHLLGLDEDELAERGLD